MDFVERVFQTAIYTQKPKYIEPEVDEARRCLVQREVLNKKQITVKKRVHFESQISERNEFKEGVRVKILMRKEEAGRLLSKCKDGGNILEFKDVVNALLEIPNDRVIVVSGNRKDD